MELDGGGTVWFTIKGWNYAQGALNVQFHVVNESGKVVYPKDGGWVSKYIPKDAENYTLASFERDVFGVGNHTYTVIARISGEEEKDTATIIVKPVNGTKLRQVGFECDDPEFNWNHGEYTATLVCKAFVYNPSQNSIEISTVSVKEWSVDNPDLKDSLEHAWVVGYPSVIHRSETGVITFENTAHTRLGTLEKDLFGAYVGVSIEYVISPQNLRDLTFRGFDTINIKQDDSDVIGDIGVNVGVTIVLGELLELPRAAKIAWDFIGPIIIGKIKNKILG